MSVLSLSHHIGKKTYQNTCLLFWFFISTYCPIFPINANHRGY